MKRKTNKKQNILKILFSILSIIIIGVIISVSLFYEDNWSYNWKGIRKNIKDSVKIVEYQGISSGIGANGINASSEINRMEWIINNANEKELLKLLKYPNGNVKALAYKGLISKKDFDRKAELILQSINDTIYPIYYKSGCEETEMKISAYLVQRVLMIDNQIPPFPPELIKDFGLSELEKENILTKFHNRINK